MLKRILNKFLRNYRHYRSDPGWPAWLENLGVRLLPGRLGVALHPISRMADRDAIGPLQRSEALLLFAAAATTQPRVIVEFGFYAGDSAATLLKSVPRETKVYSFDVEPAVQGRARRLERRYPNFRFLLKSQAEFDAADVDGAKVDFVFLDASHDFDLNCATWSRILPTLSEHALVFVHDTGTWIRREFTKLHELFVEHDPDGKWITGELYAHEPHERRFVNWVQQKHPEFAAVHFHSENVLRNGLTLLQRRRVLEG